MLMSQIRTASFRQHTELTCSLVNAALNDSSDNGWSTLAKYHLMVSVDKLIRRCNEKYSRILHLITADDFAELPPHCIPIIPTSDVQLLRIIIHELNIKDQVPHTLDHLKQEPESIPSMQVFRDVHKVLVFLIDGVKTAAEVVQNILKNADIDRDALELAANKLFHLVVPIAGLSTTSTIKFVVEELIAKALPERSEQVNEQIEDERRVRQKEKEKKKQEARAAAEEKRKQRVANAQAKMQRQMAREPSTTLPASEAVQDSASPELENIAAPSTAPEHTVLNDEDFTNDEEISDWDVDFHNLFDLKADTESRKVMTWLRLVGNTIHCARLFKKSKRGHSMPPLVFDILDYDRSPAYSLPWEAKIKELMPSYLYAEALKKLQEVDPRLKPGATLTFPGRVHCESMLASTLLMAKLRPKTEVSSSKFLLFLVTDRFKAKLESSVLARRVIHLPLFGVSKKCCPLCYRLLCEILDELKEPVTTFASHSTMFPWALPPGLPRRITQVLKDQCEKKLEYELHQLIRNSGHRPSSFLSQGPMESGSDQELIDFISGLFPMAVD